MLIMSATVEPKWGRRTGDGVFETWAGGDLDLPDACKDGVHVIFLGRGSHSTESLARVFDLKDLGCLDSEASHVAISLRASSKPSLLPRSLIELLSGGGITG